jgi:hypothetical protein
LVNAIKNHRAVVSNGPLIEVQVDGASIGDEVRTDDDVEVTVSVRWPQWCAPNRLTVWVNGVAVSSADLSPTAGAYDGAFPLSLGQDSWVVVEVTGDSNLFPVVVPAEYQSPEFSELIGALASTFDLSALSAYGTLAPPLRRVVTPYAISNPIWLNTDGGEWTAPEAPLARRSAKPPSLKEAFLRLRDLQALPSDAANAGQRVSP